MLSIYDPLNIPAITLLLKEGGKKDFLIHPDASLRKINVFDLVADSVLSGSGICITLRDVLISND